MKMKEEEIKNTEEGDIGIPHGEKVLLEPANTRFNNGDRLVCVYIRFYFITTDELLEK